MVKIGPYSAARDYRNFHFMANLNTIFFHLLQGTPADVLYKGTITRLITEDSPSRERGREDTPSKGHVVYEGISGHILSFDRKCTQTCKCSQLKW